jgi:hypothetical protein
MNALSDSCRISDLIATFKPAETPTQHPTFSKAECQQNGKPQLPSIIMQILIKSAGSLELSFIAHFLNKAITSHLLET